MELKDILLNRDEGAAALLGEAMVWLIGHPAALDERALTETLQALRETRPAMAGFSVLADLIEEGVELGAEPVELLQRIHRKYGTTDERQARVFAELLKDEPFTSVATLSWSTAVSYCLAELADQIPSARVLESNPGGEGKRMVETLRRKMEIVTLYPDEEIERVAEGAHFGVIGADTVFADGAVLNKVLSRRLAELLKENGKPFYVLASKWKLSSETSADFTPHPSDVGVFEIVSPDLITGIVTEDGLLDG